MLGTIRYLAPERLQGESDARSDVHALGLILYELLALRPAFDAPSQPTLIERIAAGAAKRPRAIDPSIPVDLETITLKAMDPIPASRYDSAAAMAADLQAYLDARPITARPPTLGYLVRLAMRRHKALSATAGIAALLLVLATATYVISLRRALDDAEAARQDEVRARDDAEFRSYVAAISAAKSALESGDLVTARKHLAAAPPKWRHWEWQHLSSRCDRSVLTIQLPKPKVSRHEYDPKARVRFLPDGGRFLCVSFDRISLRNAHTGALLAERSTEDNLARHDVALAPDGSWFVVRGHQCAEIWTVSPLESRRRFVVGETNDAAIDPRGGQIAIGTRSGEITLWSRETAKRVRTIAAHAAGVSGVAYSPDGRLLASASHDGRVKLHDMRTRETRSLFHARDRACRGVAFDPSGKRLVVGFADGLVRTFDAASGRECLTIGVGTEVHHGPCWSADGRRLAVGTLDGHTRIYDADTGRLVVRLAGHSGKVTSMSFDPAGDRLATAALDLTIKTWALDDPAAIRESRAHGRDCAGVAFTTDGALLATAGERDTMVHLHDPSTMERAGVLLGHRDWVTAIAYSPVRGHLVSGGIRGEVIQWDLDQHRVARRFQAIDRRIWSLAFHPDGDLLIVGGSNRVTALDLASGRTRWSRRLLAKTVFGVACDPTGTHIAAATSPSRIFLLDAATGTIRSTLRGHEDWTRDVAFFDGGRRLASGSLDRTLRTWDVRTGEAEHVMTGHMHGIRAVDVSPDGRRIVSAASDGVVKLWDPLRGVEVYSCRHSTAWSSCVGFSPDGRRIAVGQTFRVTVFDSATMVDSIADIRRWRRVRPAVETWSTRLLATHGGADAALAALATTEGIPTGARPYVKRRLRSYPGTRARMTEWAWRTLTGPARNEQNDYLAWRRVATIRHRKSTWRLYFLQGMANYRLGKLKQARGMLAKEPDAPLDRETARARLAFLAMTYAKLNRPADAKNTLAALRDAVAAGGTPTTTRLLTEAAALVDARERP